MYVMDYFSCEEIVTLGYLLKRDLKVLQRLYNAWGPSMRNCLRISEDHSQEGFYADQVEIVVQDFVRTFRHTPTYFDPLKESHKAEVAEQITFYKTLSTHKWFGSSTGYILESYVVCSSRLVASSLHSHWACQASLFTIQVTVSSSHSTKRDGFDYIRREVPSSFLRDRRWFHVFVTNSRKKARKLQKQKLKDLSDDVTICSAVFDVGRLGSIHDRLTEMDKHKECNTTDEIIHGSFGDDSDDDESDTE
ncbi:hypothetical protein EDB87DRAFT_1577603 [Lactarius vividus]|nr:hypothetical protein EDB87DRAFT_1577603 [Lactarius vividus]